MLIDAATVANNVDQHCVPAVTLRAFEPQFSNDNFNNESHTTWHCYERTKLSKMRRNESRRRRCLLHDAVTSFPLREYKYKYSKPIWKYMVYVLCTWLTDWVEMRIVHSALLERTATQSGSGNGRVGGKRELHTNRTSVSTDLSLNVVEFSVHFKIRLTPCAVDKSRAPLFNRH